MAYVLRSALAPLKGPVRRWAAKRDGRILTASSQCEGFSTKQFGPFSGQRAILRDSPQSSALTVTGRTFFHTWKRFGIIYLYLLSLALFSYDTHTVALALKSPNIVLARHLSTRRLHVAHRGALRPRSRAARAATRGQTR